MNIYSIEKNLFLLKRLAVILEIPPNEMVLGNDLYSAFYARLKKKAYITKTVKARNLQEKIKKQCEDLSPSTDVTDKVVCIHAIYTFLLPTHLLETKRGKIRKKYDLTNLSKVVEDGMFASLDGLDDGQITRKIEHKSISPGDFVLIDMALELYGDEDTC